MPLAMADVEKDALEAWLKKKRGQRDLASPPATRAREQTLRGREYGRDMRYGL